MNHAEFKDCLSQLTRKQKTVLELFLAGKKDKEIGEQLDTTANNITKHLNKICNGFGFSNGEGEHYRYRDLFLDECIAHIPEQVSPELKAHCRIQFEIAEYPGRPLSHNSPFYLTQFEAESKYLRELKIPGGLLRIKGAKKRGKTSLVNRLLQKAQEAGYRYVYLNLGMIDETIIQDLDRFLKWLCASISKRLGETPQFEGWDSELYGSLSNCSDYISENLLASDSPPLVLALDEVDRLFAYPVIATDFFSLLRGWYERRNIEPEIWSNLRQVIAYSTDVYIKLNINQSPFNIGAPHDLPLLTPEQIKELSFRYGLSICQSDIDRLEQWLGGHPYLVQLALYHCQLEEVSLSRFLSSSSEILEIYKRHLSHLEDQLQSQPKVIQSFRAILFGDKTPDLTQSTRFKLEGLGLIGSNQESLVSCRLYQHYFQSRIA